jgi:hypothetical protein
VHHVDVESLGAQPAIDGVGQHDFVLDHQYAHTKHCGQPWQREL